jgi:hypothetical protein
MITVMGESDLYYVDTQKLLETIEEKGYTLTTFTRGLHIGMNAFFAYLRYPENFTVGLIEKTARLLELSQTEVNSIFFCQQTFVNRKMQLTKL